MATLGNIKWGAQYRMVDENDSGSTKTINGLNLDQSNSDGSVTINAGLVDDLVRSLAAFSTETLTTVNLIETREVIDNG